MSDVEVVAQGANIELHYGGAVYVYTLTGAVLQSITQDDEPVEVTLLDKMYVQARALEVCLDVETARHWLSTYEAHTTKETQGENFGSFACGHWAFAVFPSMRVDIRETRRETAAILPIWVA